MSKKDKAKELGPNSIDMGERGIYDKRNTLNELTGKEWVYFTNSVWITGYSPTAKENIGLNHRKIHPSPKPPALMRDIVLFFTKSGGKIFDPFCGVGGTLLGTSMAGGGRKAIGIELEPKYIEAYKSVCAEEHIPEMTLIQDDSNNMLHHPEISNEVFDLIIADPPYSDMMKKARTGQRKKLYNDSTPRPYTDDSADLGNMTRDDFFVALRNIMNLCYSRLKDKGYMVVFCKDLQPEPNNPNLLHAEIVKELSKIDGLVYRGMRIWHDQAMSLFPFGYPFSFVMNQIHQYILIFRKEK